MSSREERRRVRQEVAARWGSWFTAALDGAGVTAEQFDAVTGGAFGRSTVAKWRTGVMAASPEHALLVANLLHLSAYDALHAAGHDDLIREIEAIRAAHEAMADALPRVRESTEIAAPASGHPQPTLAEMAQALEAVRADVDRHEVEIESIADQAHRQQGALNATRGQVDEVRADVDALTGEAGTTDRALRGHIDDPRAHEHPDSEY